MHPLWQSSAVFQSWKATTMQWVPAGQFVMVVNMNLFPDKAIYIQN